VRKCTEACRPLALLTADRQAQLCRHLFLAVSLLVSLRPWCGICCFAPKICSIAPIAPAIGARICQAITVERWRDRPGLRYQTARASDRRAGLGGSHQIFGASGFFGPGYFSTKSFDARDRGPVQPGGGGPRAAYSPRRRVIVVEAASELKTKKDRARLPQACAISAIHCLVAAGRLVATLVSAVRSMGIDRNNHRGPRFTGRPRFARKGGQQPSG
jgi:hypothetical protein